MILNRLGHRFGDTARKIMVPVKTVVSKRAKKQQKQKKQAVSSKASKGAKAQPTRQFYKVREDGTVISTTPIQENRNPNMPNTFQVRPYVNSPTGVLIPKGARDDQ